LHDVPEDRLATYGQHRLGEELARFADASPLPAAQDDRLHPHGGRAIARMAPAPWRRFWEEGLRDTGGDVWLSASALAVAASAISYAIHDNNGNLSPLALALVTLSIACAALAIVHPRIPAVESWGDRPAMIILS